MICNFRAECMLDVLRFIDEVSQRFRIRKFTLMPDPVFPDVEAELDASCALADLAAIAGELEDCHTIVESLEQVSAANVSP